MSILLIVIHIVVCIALIMIVLLQTGKGADMGAAFGGGSSQTLFGSTGASTFLSKATTGAAIIFMVTSLGLAYLSSHRTAGDSVVTSTPPFVESSAQPAPAAPAPAAPPAAGGSASQPANQSE
jgi:preprotein translocase subunit SecG